MSHFPFKNIQRNCIIKQYLSDYSIFIGRYLRFLSYYCNQFKNVPLGGVIIAQNSLYFGCFFSRGFVISVIVFNSIITNLPIYSLIRLEYYMIKIKPSALRLFAPQIIDICAAYLRFKCIYIRINGSIQIEVVPDILRYL